MEPCPLVDLIYDTASTSLTVHIAHFNVTGDDFGQLHKLYQKIYEYLDEWFDKLGERQRALGEVVPTNPVMPSATPESGDMLASGTSVLANLRDCVMKAIESEDNLVTQNMLLSYAEGLDKFLWMLDASAKPDADDQD